MKVADTSLPATASHMKKASLQIGLQRSKPILPQRGKMGIPLQSLMTHLPPHQRGTHSPIPYYRKMEDELKKAYQYFEWNDRSGAYRYYEEIQKKVAAQVKDWKAINPRVEITSVRIMLFST